ncbi:MAG: T9SS type A sorting domain-containing protein [Bacteroidetes bacterium]|nr:T9SS type A sorting domain-containing protein [Bacteroidota bacterium]
MKKFVLFIGLAISINLQAQTMKVLFDASSAQMAGNADWVVDADTRNLRVSNSGTMVTGGNESNPQRIPTPAQSGIATSTAKHFWSGALSDWAVDLAKKGFIIESLPYNGLITYGVSSNAQDLSNYKVFIIDEPNIRFTAAERTALLNYVANGGGLFMIADHTVSDRNNDGWDSPAIFNDLMTNNGSVTNPFGIAFDLQNFSQTSYNILNSAADPILHGVMGNVTGIQFNNGTSMTLNRTANSTVTGLIFKTGASTTGTTLSLFAASNYGTGKVCGLGDSSPPDDGTGDPNDVLYTGYKTAVSGSHQKLLVNAVIWLATPGTEPRMSAPTIAAASTLGMKLYPNPADDQIHLSYVSNENNASIVTVIDLTGHVVFNQVLDQTGSTGELVLDLSNYSEGMYVVTLQNGKDVITQRFIRQ